VRAASANIRTTGGKPMGEFAFRDTIERVGVFSDLRAIFRKHGLNLAVADVEEAEAFNVAKLRQMGLDREMLRRLSPGMQITAGAEFLRFRLTPL
jgi:hypothetical protein